MKQGWHYVVLEANLAPYRGPFPVDIRFHYRLKGRLIDSTNTFFMGKALEDALVVAGILPDDNPKFIRWSCGRSDKAGSGELDTVEVEIVAVTDVDV